MRIRRSRQTRHFTVLPNALLRDKRLSYTTRGVACEILSRPDGWDGSADDLWRQARRDRPGRREGRRVFRGAYAELEAAGYLIRSRERDPSGHWTTVLTMYDTPQHRGTKSGTSA
jgi:hypothetical protein